MHRVRRGRCAPCRGHGRHERSGAGVDSDPDVSWGLAEFVAAEEMERLRGYWWSPDGSRLAAARVDERPVRIWHIAAPIDPGAPSRPVRYPGAGTDNAVVTLAIVDLDGRRVDVEWDPGAFPYLVNVVWNAHGPLTVLVESRISARCRSCGSIPERRGRPRPRGSRRPMARHHRRGPRMAPQRPPGPHLGWRRHQAPDVRRVPVTPVGLQVAQVLDVGEASCSARTRIPPRRTCGASTRQAR